MRKIMFIIAAIAVALTGSMAVASATTSPEPKPYVTVAWLVPEGESIWPQSYVTSVETDTSNLHALDASLTECGVYQIDAYHNGPGIQSVIDTGVLNGPSEDGAFLVGQEGVGWKFIEVTDCTPPTTVTPPTTTPDEPTTTTTPDCQEDEPCWDCETMGNKVCGTAATLTRGPEYVPTVPAPATPTVVTPGFTG